MTAPSLHWFRRKQRAVSRFVLAAFCLTWLQLAAMPCVMAMGAVAAAPAAMDSGASHVGPMPDGMVMAPGEHCMYCPPEPTPDSDAAVQAFCTFPDDPQVDSRAAFASALLAPPPVLVLLAPHDRGPVVIDTGPTAGKAPPTGTPLAVSLCRFLK